MQDTNSHSAPRTIQRGVVGPGLLVAAGAVLLLNNVIPEFNVGQWWPVFLIVIGAGLLADRAGRCNPAKH